jgi:hypothetical protein
VQRLEIHVLEIHILAQVLEQGCVEQNLEFFSCRSAAILVALAVGPLADVRGDIASADVQRLGMLWNVQPGQDFGGQVEFVLVLAFMVAFILEESNRECTRS